MALLLYSAYLLVRETRALRILYGIFVLGVIYLIGQIFNLVALNFILRSVFAVTLVAIPVVFQPELRAALERLGRGQVLSSLRSSRRSTLEYGLEELIREIKILAKSKVGALMVFERSTGLKDLIDTGVSLNADLSAELVDSIFNRKSPLHDGAIIIRGNKILAASVFLPLTEEVEDSSLGTRHRAALGLSKETDALVVTVSEETGRISLANRGRLERIEVEKLEKKLKRALIKND
ncbi:diadenylate cyclase CdaA [Candidatus Berkelbacteria bacterium]|nr:diadenylate cyclase CdaA [Candidatus Berkelbacteria bacterium]